ncbi:protein LDOC1-like [Mantella aurantiaca]
MLEPAGGTSQMDELCNNISAISQAVNRLQDGSRQLEGRMHTLTCLATSEPVAPSPEPRVPTPDRFSGNRSKFRSFRHSCQLYFSLQPRTFSVESTKVGFIISLLQGESQTWAHRLMVCP